MGIWIMGRGSWVNINVNSGTVTGLGYDSSGNAEVSIAGAMGSNAWGAWSQNLGTGVALNMLSGNSSAANNGSWGWNFTKSFAGGLVSSAGWKSVYNSLVDEDGCDYLMMATFAGSFNPLPDEGPNASDAAELGPKVVAQAGKTAASAYSVYRGLSVPLRSSIYRGLQSSTYGYAAALEEAAPYLQVGYATGNALATAGSAAYDGECH